MGLKGDFQGLRRLRGQLADMKSPAFMRAMSEVLAAEARELVDEGFASSKDPSGQPWAPLAMRDGQPLRDTGRLQRSFTTEVHDRGFVIGTNTRYAHVHQFGATIEPVAAKALAFQVRGRGWVRLKKAVIPARKMLPDGGRLPPPWDRAMKAAARAQMKANF